ncbi:uncharacterized protein LOC130778693 [Actinidia eriantha]|uniref:uncharacterized protein LOC130778693 n=1 Tax=Actinidia eriantha TaxID=165200 RepID=UPI00258BA331|nr:uncharacterized protein LOC130778693 [Actinidia eriantha]
MEEKLEKDSLDIRSLQVLISAVNRFEVRGKTIEIVDIDQRNCSYKGWQLTESVHPAPNVDRPKQKDSSQNVVIVTLHTRHPPGWPTTISFGSEEVVKRQLQCRRCKSAGHTKSSCKEFLSDCSYTACPKCAVVCSRNISNEPVLYMRTVI